MSSDSTMDVQVFYSEHPIPRFHLSEQTEGSQKLLLTYLNEGGANFVFKILPHMVSKEIPLRLRCKLLRLRKDLPHVQSAEEQLAAFNEYFKPLFPPENLIQYELIELNHGFADHLNNALKVFNRPSHRTHDFLPANETYGLLVTDMTPRKGDILLQLKPKWLAHSPNAPAEAKRCRTCALRASRASQKIQTATDAQESCPLALISDSTAERKRATQGITSDNQFQEYLMNDAQALLHTLRSWQIKLDRCGILDSHTEQYVQDYCKAMTLRDCTLFLKRSDDQIDARLADLDLKQSEKVATWKKVEEQLISGGWYTNEEDEAKWIKENLCLLSR